MLKRVITRQFEQMLQLLRFKGGRSTTALAILQAFHHIPSGGLFLNPPGSPQPGQFGD
jgi:hypothetical protein